MRGLRWVPPLQPPCRPLATSLSLFCPLARSLTEPAWLPSAGLKQPRFGIPGGDSSGRKARWCKACAAKAHPAAQDTSSARCEDCGVKRSRFGRPGPGSRSLWCAGCAKQKHPGAVDVFSNPKPKCQGCGAKHPSFGLPGDGNLRLWCAACARNQKGAVNIPHPAAAVAAGAPRTAGATGPPPSVLPQVGNQPGPAALCPFCRAPSPPCGARTQQAVEMIARPRRTGGGGTGGRH